MAVSNLHQGVIAGASGSTAFDTTLIGDSIWLEGSGTSGDAMTRTWGTESNQDRWIWATWYQPLRVIDATADRNNIFATGSGSNGFYLQHTSTSSTFLVFHRDNAGNEGAINTTEEYRDLTTWYHILVDYDSANATADNRISLYINGVKTGVNSGTRPGQNNHLNVNVSGQTARIGQDFSSTPNYHVKGYLAQTIFLDNKSIANGDLAITDFLDTFTFGTNGSQYVPKSDADITALATSAGGNSFSLDFSAASVALSSGVTPTSSAGTHSGSLSNLTDGDYTNDWRSTVDPATNVSNAEISFDLGSAKDVKAVKITGRASATGNYKVQFSDNGSDFTDTGTTFSNISITTTADSGILDLTSDNPGSHRYWKLINISNSVGTSAWGFREITLASTVGNLGTDASGNSNDFTAVSSSITSANQSANTPSNVYPFMNPLDQDPSTSTTLSEGNLKVSMGTAAGDGIRATLPCSGKVYWEVEIDSISSNSGSNIGIATNNHNLTLTADDTSGNGQRNAFVGVSSYSSNLVGFISGSNFDSSYGGLGNNFGTAGKYLMFAVDIDAGKFWAGYDGTWFNSGNPAAGSNDSGKNLDLYDTWFPTISRIGSAGSEVFIFNFGQSSFAHTVPTGFVSLNSANLTAPTHQGCDYFAATKYQGNGTAIGSGGLTVNNSAFSPALVWIKNRDASDDHALYDTQRGVTKQIESNTQTIESTESEGLTAFTSTGFTVGNLDQVNTNTEDFIAWQWKAGTSFSGAGSGGAEGTVASSGVVAAPDHFSIFKFVANSGSAYTAKHGLSAAPEFFVVKHSGTSGSAWVAYAKHAASDAETDYLLLDSSNAKVDDATVWNDTAPDANVISIGTNSTINNGTNAMIGYAWRSVAGVCKVGSYEGNSNDDGPYISLGFKPRWWIVKETTVSDASHDWFVADSARYTYNGTTSAGGANGGTLEANDSTAEESHATNHTDNPAFDFLSDGIKLRTNSGVINNTGRTYIYIAMAEIGGNGTLPPIYGR